MCIMLVGDDYEELSQEYFECRFVFGRDDTFVCPANQMCALYSGGDYNLSLL